MQEIINLIINQVEEKKGENILYVNTEGGINAITDGIIVVSALNEVHLKAIVNEIVSFYKDNKKSAFSALEYFGASGKPESQWVILDFNSLVIHIMGKDVREQYEFDELFNNYENFRYH